MKAILEFNNDEKVEFQWAINGYKYWKSLDEFHELLRKKLKHEELPDEVWNALDHLKSQFFEILNENDCTLTMDGEV